MATFTTYDQVGQKENVSDVISMISPTKTPFQSSIKNEKMKARLHQWQEDALRAVIDNANVEGFTAVDATLTATTMRSNYAQIFQKTIKIAETSDAVELYGRATETARQLSKGMAEVKRDLENTFVGLVQAAAVGDAASVPRRMASVWPQIAAGNTVTNASSALTETNVLTALQNAYNAGAEPDTLMVKPADSLIVAGFAQSAGRTRNFNDDQKTVVNAVNLYVSPFGEVKVVLNRFQKTTEALIYSADNWKQLVLRNWTRETLAKTGDNNIQLIVGEFSLKHVNQTASARITGLT